MVDVQALHAPQDDQGAVEIFQAAAEADGDQQVVGDLRDPSGRSVFSRQVMACCSQLSASANSPAAARTLVSRLRTS